MRKQRFHLFCVGYGLEEEMYRSVDKVTRRVVRHRLSSHQFNVFWEIQQLIISVYTNKNYYL
jgi:hypothetical protein